MMRRVKAVALPLCAAVLAAGCSGRAASDDKAAVTVVTTTEILGDLVHNVGGDRVRVSSIVPSGADPHSYEPAPADARRVAEADMTFTNHLLLEEHALIKTIDSNARKDAPNVSLAEASESYGATVIPLVENIGLDVVWLGLAVRGDGKARGATRASDVLLSASTLDGPGALTIYLTEALGEPKVYVNSADGLDDKDTTTLPPAAHTHLNWAFSKPGIYRLTMSARLDTHSGTPTPVGEGTFTFAVGVDPHTAGKPTIIDKGHSDLAVDLDTGELYAYTDVAVAGQQQAVPADQVVFDVPNRALTEIPNDPRFAFLGAPGTSIHQLPQAVLGKHVHGEIDPHLWQDARNAKAYVQLIRDTLVKRDPAGAQTYQDNARAYLSKLDELDAYLRDHLGKIPPDRRQLITTHDGFGYLAKAYGLTVAGFVVPNPAQQPSAEQVRKLTETIRNLHVPAVFAEHGLAERANVLRQVATDQHVRVCQLYGDAFDQQIKSYVDMMRHNADELLACLGGEQR
jgi:anchored repeat ABC transporter substrate-binding protein